MLGWDHCDWPKRGSCSISGSATSSPTAGWECFSITVALGRLGGHDDPRISSPHYSRQWLGRVATSAKLTPHSQWSAGLLHLTPDSPPARTVTLQVRWSGVQWQLPPLTNAEDWHTMSQPVDENLCGTLSVAVFWRSQAGPVPLSEQPRVLGSFMSDLQRACHPSRLSCESGPLPQEEAIRCQNNPVAVELGSHQS